MIIRAEQIKTFEKAAEKRFENEMVVYLNDNWKGQCDLLGEKGVRRSVRKGVENAKQYGFTTENHIAKYINLMYALEFDFDTSEEFPWAGETLKDDSIKPEFKIDLLYRSLVI